MSINSVNHYNQNLSKMKATTYIQNQVKKEMRQSGKLALIDARNAHFEKVANGLGFENSRAAFRSMGQKFIELAKVGAPSINAANS